MIIYDKIYLGGNGMYLYDKKDNHFDVYIMKENEKLAEEYRQGQMMKEKLLDEENYYYDRLSYLPLEDRLFYSEDLGYRLCRYLERPSIAIIRRDLQNYCQGRFKKHYVSRICTFTNGKHNIRYFLSPHFQQMYYYIEIPKSLYILYLLENEKYSSLGDEKILPKECFEQLWQPLEERENYPKNYIENYSDYNEQLNLFDINKVNELSFDTLKTVDSCGITKGAYARTITKAENDSRILKLIKK